MGLKEEWKAARKREQLEFAFIIITVVLLVSYLMLR